ncbi:hypothetical protein BGX27_010457 [Mortierella sp. AM989]|nr:hypothetical protein BGX27_010457 [Mortierella sp. AM989]
MLAPLVGASEGPVWSPYLKTPQLVSKEQRSYHSLAIPRVRSRNGSSSSAQTSLSSSPCFSLSVPSEDEDELFNMYDQARLENEGRASLGTLAQEPPSPVPRFAKLKAAFSSRRRD